MSNINRSHYPELNHILWDIDQKFIPAQLAFVFYENRWAYISQQKLLPKEKKLIARLTKEFGQGVFMPALYN